MAADTDMFANFDPEIAGRHFENRPSCRLILRVGAYVVGLRSRIALD